MASCACACVSECVPWCFASLGTMFCVVHTGILDVLLLIQVDCCNVNVLLLIQTRYLNSAIYCWYTLFKFSVLLLIQTHYLNSVFYCWYKHCLKAVFCCWYKRTVAMPMFCWWYKHLFEIWVLCCCYIPYGNVIVLLQIEAHYCSVDVLFLVRNII